MAGRCRSAAASVYGRTCGQHHGAFHSDIQARSNEQSSLAAAAAEPRDAAGQQPPSRQEPARENLIIDV